MKTDTLFLFFIVAVTLLLALRYVQVFVTEKVYRSRVANHEILFTNLQRRVYTRDAIARKVLRSFYFSWFPYLPKSLIDDIYQMVKHGKANKWTAGSEYSVLISKEGKIVRKEVGSMRYDTTKFQNFLEELSER